VEPLVEGIDRATVAGSGVGAVEDVLGGEVDLRGLGFTLYLDAITQGGDIGVYPARA
jgi:hypothetical protein